MGLATPLVPPARASMEVMHAVRLLALQACLQDVREQVVVAVPLAARVKRDHEEIPPIEDLERRLAVILSRDRIAQGTGQPIEDAGPQEEPAHILGLSLQDFLDEVVDDEAIVSGETRDEVVDIVSALHRQSSKLERRDPTLRPLLQSGDLARIEVQLGRLTQIRRSLGTGEAQVCGSNLDELTLSPQTRQRDRWIGACRDHDVRGGRQDLEQETDVVVDLGGLDRVVVIEHHHGVAPRGGKLVDKRGDDPLDRWGLGLLQHREGCPCLWKGTMDRCGYGCPEGAGLVVARVEGQPRCDAIIRVGRRKPLRKHGGLAESRRGGDERQLRPQPTVQARHEPSASYR